MPGVRACKDGHGRLCTHAPLELAILPCRLVGNQNSYQPPEAEPIILTELSRLADRVVGDVFESFSKHPMDIKKCEQLDRARLTTGDSK